MGVGVEIELFSQEVPGEQHNNREKKREREEEKRKNNCRIKDRMKNGPGFESQRVPFGPYFFFCLLVNSVQINYYYYAVLLLAEVKTHSSIRRDIQSCSRHLHNAIQ